MEWTQIEAKWHDMAHRLRQAPAPLDTPANRPANRPAVTADADTGRRIPQELAGRQPEDAAPRSPI